MSQEAVSTIWRDLRSYEVLMRGRQLFIDPLALLLQETINTYPQLQSPRKVLEIGAGHGYLSWLANGSLDHMFALEGFQDASAMKSRTEQKVTADMKQLPFADDSLDSAIGMAVLDVLPYKLLIPQLNEICRVLKPGGIFVHLLDLSADPSHMVREIMRKNILPMPVEKDGVVSSSYVNIYPDRHLRMSFKKVMKSMGYDIEKWVMSFRRYIGAANGLFGEEAKTENLEFLRRFYSEISERERSALEERNINDYFLEKLKETSRYLGGFPLTDSGYISVTGRMSRSYLPQSMQQRPISRLFLDRGDPITKEYADGIARDEVIIGANMQFAVWQKS